MKSLKISVVFFNVSKLDTNGGEGILIWSWCSPPFVTESGSLFLSTLFCKSSVPSHMHCPRKKSTCVSRKIFYCKQMNETISDSIDLRRRGFKSHKSDPKLLEPQKHMNPPHFKNYLNFFSRIPAATFSPTRHNFSKASLLQICFKQKLSLTKWEERMNKSTNVYWTTLCRLSASLWDRPLHPCSHFLTIQIVNVLR